MLLLVQGVRMSIMRLLLASGCVQVFDFVHGPRTQSPWGGTTARLPDKNEKMEWPFVRFLTHSNGATATAAMCVLSRANG